MTLSLPVLLLTRPEPAARRVVDQLQQAGARFHPILSPLIGIEITGPLPDMDDARGVIFTSANGVRAYGELGGRRDLVAYTVGAKTAQAARDLGMVAQSADGNAETLIAWLKDRRPDGPLVHVRGRFSRGDVAGRLSAAGIATRAAIVYDQPEIAPSADARAALGGNLPVVVPLYSPRSAALLGKMQIKAPLLVAALSEAVANAASALHITELRIAPRPDSGALLPLVVELLAHAQAGKV